MADYILKYLFEVEFEDGSVYKQTPEDRSKIDPEKRSEFYDIIQSEKAIKKFSLIGEGNKITVDLETGLFWINDLNVLLESEKLPRLPEHFELVFYRQHTHDVNVTYAKDTGKEIKRDDPTHFIEYFIGWKCEIQGKVYQQKIAVA